MRDRPKHTTVMSVKESQLRTHLSLSEMSLKQISDHEHNVPKVRLRWREQAGDEDGQKANEENQTVSVEMERPGTGSGGEV